jgi:hypothetical protein
LDSATARFSVVMGEGAAPAGHRTDPESFVEHQVDDLQKAIDGLIERMTLIAEHAETRLRAAKYRWYLEVQREAVGLRRQDVLDEMHRIPPPL